jgi:hypothetical protein
MELFQAGVTKLQKRAEQDRHWMIDMIKVLSDACAALNETQTFDSDHGDSIELDPASWTRAVQIEIRELRSFAELTPLIRAIEARGYHIGDKRDNAKYGARTYTIWADDTYQSIDLTGRLTSEVVPECEVIEVTEVSVKQQFVCEGEVV